MLKVLILIAAFWITPDPSVPIGVAQNTDDDSASVAVINNIEYSLQDFRNDYVDHLLATGMADSPRARKDFLDRHIRKILVIEDVKRSAIPGSPAYQLEKSRIERKLLIEGLLAAEVYSRIEVTEDDLRDMFVRINTSVSASHLYAPTAAAAATLHDRLLAGEPFETLAAETFQDSTLAHNGGSLGYFAFDEMDPAFEDAAHQLDIGEISSPVRTAQGYSIIRVDDRFIKPILTESEYATKKDRVESYVTVRKRQQARRDFLNQIGALLNIEMHDESVAAFFAELNGANISNTEFPGLDASAPLANTSTGAVTVAHVLEEARFSGDELRSQIRSVEKMEAFVRGVALRRAIVRMATDNGVARTDAFETARHAALDEWLYEQAWNEWKSSVSVSDSDAQVFYEQHGHDMIGDERVPVWEIVVADEQSAIDLAYRATLENFERLAITNSIRPGADESRGFLGDLARHELGVVADIIFNASENSIVGPVPIGGRFAIFRIGNRIPAGPASFDEVEDDIRQILAHDKLTELVRVQVDELVADADINIDSELLFGFELRSTAHAGIIND